jgi:hypothetical protein
VTDDDDDDDDDPYLYTRKFKGLMANYTDSTSTKRQQTKSKQDQTRAKSGKKCKKTLQLI